ncbi:hypothetical protein AAUPMC_12391, partial [Pasteurella multocida subsp. multocida str. Anand1_cattle]
HHNEVAPKKPAFGVINMAIKNKPANRQERISFKPKIKILY